MSSRHEVEMEKQFLADLEKAKALSLETHELEKIRKQRYSQPDPSIYSESNNLEEYKQYLQRKAQLHQAKTGTTALSSSGPPSSARRNSDTRNPLATAPTSSSDLLQRGKDEADLISFNPPPPVPNPQDEAHNNLKELVDKMHRMNTQQQYEHPVYKTQRSYSVASAPTYGGYTSAYLQQQVVPNYNPAAMQLVPYQQTTSDKPTKLTPDELARLYSMPTAYGVAPQPGFIPQGQYQPNAYLPHSQFPVQYAPAPPTAFIPQSQPVAATVAPPAPGFIVQPPSNPLAATVANPESALVHVPKPVAPVSKLTLANRSTSQPVQPFPPAIPGPSSASSNPFARNSVGATGSGVAASSSASTATTAKSNGEQVVLRPKSDPARLGDNLIDLGAFEENSRVSVLEAFDPLLCGHRSSNSSGGASEDDKGRPAASGGPRARGKWQNF